MKEVHDDAEATEAGMDAEGREPSTEAAPAPDSGPAPRAAGRDSEGGWVELPPDPNAVPGSEQIRRFRAPWATGPSTTGVPAAPAPTVAAVDAPPAPSTQFVTKRRKPRTEAPVSRLDADADSGTAPGSMEGPPSGQGAEPPGGAGRTEASPAPAPHAERPLTFTGSAGEFFRIWIVNVCLTALTLGLYSAWAKVRTQRYFYRHTCLDGSPFDYLAEPMQILKGRMVLGLGFVLYTAVGYTMPMAQLALSIAIVFLVPWAVVRALRFRAGVSAWRNIRFGFDAGYGEAFKVFIGLPLATALTLGLVYPYYQWRRNAFRVRNSRFGTEAFGFTTSAGQFYRLHLFIALLTLVMVVPAVALVVFFMPNLLPNAQLMAPGLAPHAAVPPGMAGMASSMVAVNLLFFLGGLWIWCYARAHATNLVWNGTHAGPHRFASSLATRELFALYVTNTIAIALSLGLMVPWARVRMARYRVQHISVEGPGLEGFAAGAGPGVGAAGDEIADALDLDLGLGL
jgi:uncharacterized membrane protein YjgN (DUF898 family)